jgi:hypothetical protein
MECPLRPRLGPEKLVCQPLCVCARVCVSSRVRVKQGCGGCLRVSTARSRQRDEWGEAKAEAAGPNACPNRTLHKGLSERREVLPRPPFHPPFVAFAPFLQAFVQHLLAPRGQRNQRPTRACVHEPDSRGGCATDGRVYLLSRKAHWGGRACEREAVAPRVTLGPVPTAQCTPHQGVTVLSRVPKTPIQVHAR